MKTVEIISVPVANQEEAKQFYTEKVGFQLLFEGNTPDGGKWIQVGLPDDQVTFTLVSGEPHASPGSLKGTIIATKDIQQDVTFLRKNGVKTEDVQEFPHGQIASFSDPDGNQWVLRQPVS
jgi:catechol 2,3-dioxygenase-like lactoylglutathione lyase family enzyme